MFDPALKSLTDQYGGDWLHWIRTLVSAPSFDSFEPFNPEIPRRPIAADRAFRMVADQPWLLHLELESQRRVGRPARFFQYNSGLHAQTRLPVLSVVLLTCCTADSHDLSGTWEVRLPDGKLITGWNYQVVRLWELDPTPLFAVPGLTPLVPLTNVPADELPAVIGRLEQTWQTLDPIESRQLRMLTSILIGLVYNADVVQRLLPRIPAMRESSVYQQILDEGRVEGRLEGLVEGRSEGQSKGREVHARSAVIRVGTRRLGPPPPQLLSVIDRETNVDRLDRMLDRAIDASSWNEITAVE